MRSRLLAMLLAVPVLLVTTLATAHATAPAPALSWTPCAEGRAQCASLVVPIVHGEPDGEKISLAIARLPAQNPATRRGTIIFHAGGPGPNLDDRALTAEALAP